MCDFLLTFLVYETLKYVLEVDAIGQNYLKQKINVCSYKYKWACRLVTNKHRHLLCMTNKPKETQQTTRNTTISQLFVDQLKVFGPVLFVLNTQMSVQRCPMLGSVRTDWTHELWLLATLVPLVLVQVRFAAVLSSTIVTHKQLTRQNWFWKHYRLSLKKLIHPQFKTFKNTNFILY